MKKYFPKVPVSKFLLFSFVILLVFLVISNYAQNKRQEYSELTLNELISKSVRRQQLLTSILKGTDYARVMVLNILMNPKSEIAELAEKKIYDQIEINNRDHRQYQTLVEGQHEQALYNELVRSRKLNSRTRKKVISLVKEGKLADALQIDREELSYLYENFQQANMNLQDFVVSRDKQKVKDATEKAVSSKRFSARMNLVLTCLLVFLGIMIARTLRILKEQNLRLAESERTYRQFTEQTNEMIESHDAKGRIIYVNDSFRKKLGYIDEELASLRISDLWEDPSQRLSEPDHKGERVIRNVKQTYISKSGKKIFMEGNILLNYNGDEFTGATAFFNDVTEKKQLEESLASSERTFRNLFNVSPIPMWVIDSDTLKFLLVNNAAIRTYGYTAEEFYNKSILEIRPAEDIVRIEENIKEWISESRKNLESGEAPPAKSRHLKKNQKLIDVEIYNTPITFDDKINILSIAIDITERTINEKRITKAIINTQEQERYEIGGELHDNVCQILAAAKMSLSLLKPSLKPEVKDLYQQSQESIMLATDEIRNLSHRLAPAFFNNTSLEKAFQSLIDTFNLDNTYNTFLYFDKRIADLNLNRDIQLNFYRILQEQLKNIIKYAHGSLIEVDVLLYKEQLKMRIADDGVGFNLDKVHQGIGLANMKRRTKMFSGTFQIETSPGNGCEVLVTLPLFALADGQ